MNHQKRKYLKDKIKDHIQKLNYHRGKLTLKNKALYIKQKLEYYLSEYSDCLDQDEKTLLSSAMEFLKLGDINSALQNLKKLCTFL